MDNIPKTSRVLRTKEAARQNYDRLSRWYDLFTGSEKAFTNIGLKVLDPRPEQTILEIGFGTGYALQKLAERKSIVHGIDLSPKMCRHARNKLQRANLTKNTLLQNGDATHLPFAGETFDAVFISFTLELFDTPEIPRVLHEIKRLLKKDGRLVVVSLQKTDRRSVHVYEWFHHNMPVLIDCRPIYADQVIKDVGFQIIQNITKSMWRLPVSIVLAQK